MLNFSKIKVSVIYLVFVFLTFFALLNFYHLENKFFDKKVNLGLDLQGGSYILLEADMDNVFSERLESIEIEVKSPPKNKGGRPRVKFQINEKLVKIVVKVSD